MNQRVQRRSRSTCPKHGQLLCQWTWTHPTGAATAPSDYTAVVNRTVTIGVGSTSVTVLVTVIDDAVVETDETFTVTLSNPANATLSTAPSAQVTIWDDDTHRQRRHCPVLVLTVLAASPRVRSVRPVSNQFG